MRKTSQDGGDSSSITSGIENEIKKPGAIIKTKRSSLKRKVQSLTHEPDDAVIEPLLQKDKEKPDTTNQSAKYNLLTKTKTDIKSEKDDEKEKLLQDDNIQNSLSNTRSIADTVISIPSSNALPKSTGAPLHNHMNTNVFSSHDALKAITTKSQILVEIDASKQTGYNPSPLIFTTAKIHTDGKTKHMEPLQVTPVPILSTIEVSVSKGTGNNSGETSAIVTSNLSNMYTHAPKTNTNILDKDQKLKAVPPAVVTTSTSILIDTKSITSSDKTSTVAKDKNIIGTTTTTDSTYKDLKSISKYAPTKDNLVSDNNHIKGKERKDKDEIRTNISLSQPLGGTSSDKIKNTISSEIGNKPVISQATTKISPANYTSKAATASAEPTTKNDKTDKQNSFVRKTDLNMNAKVTGAVDNKPDSISKDKSVVNNSAGNKQLQRQKNTTEKDDLTSSSKSNAILPESKIPKESNEIVSSTPKTVPQIKTSANDVNRLSDKTKLPKSTANNVQISSPITTVSNKLPSTTTTVTNIFNKSTTSNSVTTAVPTTTTRSTEIPVSKTSIAKPDNKGPGVPTTQPSITAKPLSSNLPTNEKNIKSTSTNASTKPTNTISSKNVASITPTAKATNISKIDVLSTSSQPISNVKEATTKPAVTKTVPQTAKSIDTTAKTPSVAVSTTKDASVSSKNTPASTVTAKTPSGSISSSKAPPVAISTTKSSVPISAVKTPVSTSPAKSSSISTTTAKSSVATSATKTSSVPVSTTKSSASKNNVLPSTTATSVTQVSAKTAMTPSANATSSADSKKKSKELSNGNKGLNA